MTERSGRSRPTSSFSARKIADFPRLALALAAALGATACGDRPDADRPLEVPPAIVERITRPGDGGAVHLVRLVQRGDTYESRPDSLEVPAGDVVRFVLTGPQPESIAFDTAAATPDAARFIRDRSLHLGVLLVEPGQAYDVSFVGAPPGRYPFLSIPHADRGMRGVVHVVDAR